MHKAIIPLFLLAAAACTGGGGGADDDSAGFDSVIYAPEYAEGFTITGRPGSQSVMVTATAPWQNADSADVSRILLLRGGEDAPAGFDGAVVDSAARRIVVMSTTHLAMLDAFGHTDAVVGVSGLDFVSNPEVSGRLDSSADVGYDGNVNYERLAALSPDLVLLYGVSSPSRMEAKLRELGIPYFYVGDYVENNPLGKAEWTVALGEITGLRAEAEAAFDSIAAAYNRYKSVASVVTDKPAVMLNIPYGDVWFMPSVRSYLIRMIDDAGGRYVYSENDTDASVPVDMERAYLLADSADIWINTGTANSLAELRQVLPRFADVRPVRRGRVFNCTRRMTPGGGNDYYESATVRPDLALCDLIGIFHPELAADSLYYYIQLR